MADSKQNEEIVLARRPEGMPVQEDFRVQKVEEGPLPDGHILLELRFVSVDPYLRGRVREHKLGEVMVSGVVAEVVATKTAEYAVGDVVVGYLPWRRRIVSDGRGGLRKVDKSLGPISTALGVLGMPAMTAYFGLFDVASLKPTDVVVVSGAAGAVGSIAGQIALLKGCRVIGLAGGDDKCAWLTGELGFHAAINYKKYPTAEAIKGQLAAACPNGVDVYFDNTGGHVTDAVFDLLNKYGRVAVCGQISMYNATETPMAPLFLHKLIYKSVTVRGFVVMDFIARAGEFYRDMAGWLREGKIKHKETVTHGFNAIPAAFIGLFKGDNTGKAIVQIDA